MSVCVGISLLSLRPPAPILHHCCRPGLNLDPLLCVSVQSRQSSCHQSYLLWHVTSRFLFLDQEYRKWRNSLWRNKHLLLVGACTDAIFTTVDNDVKGEIKDPKLCQFSSWLPIILVELVWKDPTWDENENAFHILWALFGIFSLRYSRCGRVSFKLCTASAAEYISIIVEENSGVQTKSFCSWNIHILCVCLLLHCVRSLPLMWWYIYAELWFIIRYIFVFILFVIFPSLPHYIFLFN